MSGQLEPLASARERVIESLGRHFAQDHITLEELERRLERAYRAGSSNDLAVLTQDLPAITDVPPARPVGASGALGATGAMGAAGVAPRGAEALRGVVHEPRSALREGHQRMLSIMSTRKLRGYWEPPRQLDYAAIMSESVLDFTGARMHDVMEISLTAVMAQVRIIVPEGTRVVENVTSFLAEVGNGAPWDGEPHHGALLRIRGTAFMAEVKIELAPRRRY